MSKRGNPNDTMSTPKSAPSASPPKRPKQSTKDNEDGINKWYFEPYSKVFKDMFDAALSEGRARAKGTCDEHPIVIPDVKLSQFRNLMRVFYRPPPDELFVDLGAFKKHEGYSWDNFLHCSDVAWMAGRFGMGHTEQWARGHLKSLAYAGAGEIVREASTDAPDPSPLLDVLRYSVSTSNTHMTRNIRNLIQCYCKNIADPTLGDRLLTFFRPPDLLEDDPCLYGFLFALFLSCDPAEWKKGLFTQKDQTALSSAQVHLTPFPSELMADLHAPLFQEPTLFITFFNKVWDDTTDKQCNEQWRSRTLHSWRSEFNEIYYRDITGTDFRLAILALTDIPSHILRFAENIRTCECQGNRYCSQAVLDILGQGIE